MKQAWLAHSQHWWTQGSKEKTVGERGAFEAASCSSSLGWGPTKACYLEETVLSAERRCAENSLGIQNCVDECGVGAGERSANRFIGKGMAGDLSVP